MHVPRARGDVRAELRHPHGHIARPREHVVGEVSTDPGARVAREQKLPPRRRDGDAAGVREPVGKERRAVAVRQRRVAELALHDARRAVCDIDSGVCARHAARVLDLRVEVLPRPKRDAARARKFVRDEHLERLRARVVVVHVRVDVSVRQDPEPRTRRDRCSIHCGQTVFWFRGGTFMAVLLFCGSNGHPIYRALLGPSNTV